MRPSKRVATISGIALLIILTAIGTRTYGIFHEIRMLKGMDTVLGRFPRSELSEAEEYSLDLSIALVRGRQAGLRRGVFSGFCCRLVDLYDGLAK